MIPGPNPRDNELSELAVAFNSMGSTLRNEEESRRRLTTGIAHELRSPLQNEGIPEDFLRQVFDRFSRADPSRTRGTGGSGVGLAICQKLVEAHGGTISVTSDIGVGTTFVVELPSEPSLT